MESTHSEHDHDARGADGDVDPGNPDTPPAPATSVGLWGPSGHGKTLFGGSLMDDPGYAPMVYCDVDGGRPALAGYEAADLLIHRPAPRTADVTRCIRPVQRGRVVNRAGRKARSLCVDAISVILANEIDARGLAGAAPKDQAQALIAPFKVLFAQLRSLHREHGITTVTIAHAKVNLRKVGETSHEVMVPDMFPSIARPWMQSARHVWRVMKMRGERGPAFPIMMLRTEQEGIPGTPLFCEYMKTSNIAFAQWLAGQGGKREDLRWDTGTLPIQEQPSLASLLRVADDLTFEQGRFAASNPDALRAFASLQAAIAAADDADASATTAP